MLNSTINFLPWRQEKQKFEIRMTLITSFIVAFFLFCYILFQYCTYHDSIDKLIEERKQVDKALDALKVKEKQGARRR